MGINIDKLDKKYVGHGNYMLEAKAENLKSDEPIKIGFIQKLVNFILRRL